MTGINRHISKWLAGGASATMLGIAAFSMPAAAQDSEIDLSGDITNVTGIVDGDLKSDTNARVRLNASRLLDNGLEIGGELEARLDGEIPRQYWAGGRYSSLTAGGPRGVGPLSGDAWLQGANVYARGGLGTVSVGRDNGIASQLAVTSPTIFSAIGVNDWKTDLTGMNDVHTINDFSGYATKMTYMPPANFLGGVLGGLQVGVSYTPRMIDCKDDLCAPYNGYSPLIDPETRLGANSSWKDVMETAVYYERAMGEKRDLRVGLGASYVQAQEDVDNTLSSEFDDYEAYSLGVNLGYRGFTLGGSVKNTNAAFKQEDEDGYLAFDAGLTYETGPWGFMVGYGASDAERDAASPISPAFYRQTQSAQAGVSYVFDQGVTLGAAAQFVESDKPAQLGGEENAAAVVFESGFKF